MNNKSEVNIIVQDLERYLKELESQSVRNVLSHDLYACIMHKLKTDLSNLKSISNIGQTS